MLDPVPLSSMGQAFNGMEIGDFVTNLNEITKNQETIIKKIRNTYPLDKLKDLQSSTSDIRFAQYYSQTLVVPKCNSLYNRIKAVKLIEVYLASKIIVGDQ